MAEEKLKSIPDFPPYKYLVDYNLSNIALNNSQYEKALAYYISVINSNTIQTNDRLKKIYHNVGVCYLHLKNYHASEKFLMKELEISQNEKDTSGVIYAKLDLGNLFYQQYQDDKAIFLFKEAYDLARLFHDIRLKQLASQNMAIVEKNRKHYKESVTYYTQYIR
ncbi:MAG: tetratricopeptide repeat protein [Flavobacteriaceae bacterium]|nr:MAG: tetratricopeptide repeat protein [Flavobacteriaceae bacterium]